MLAWRLLIEDFGNLLVMFIMSQLSTVAHSRWHLRILKRKKNAIVNLIKMSFLLNGCHAGVLVSQNNINSTQMLFSLPKLLYNSFMVLLLCSLVIFLMHNSSNYESVETFTLILLLYDIIVYCIL